MLRLRWRKRIAAVSLLLLSTLGMVSGASATGNTSVLITAVYYDTVLTNEPDEAVRLHNPTATGVDLSGWRLCNDSGACIAFPSGTTLVSGASIWVTREADDFTREWTFKPGLEATETDSTVPNTTGTWPTMANAGEALYLKSADGSGFEDTPPERTIQTQLFQLTDSPRSHTM